MTPRQDTSPTERNRPLSPTVDRRIGSTVTRLEEAVERRPGFGRSTSVSTTTLLDGLRCVSHDGDHRVETDLPPALGGEGSAPTPSGLLRAALGSCLAMGYRLRAARHGIVIESIRVDVETDSAIGGMVDPGSTYPPGFIEIRYRVRIDSPEPTARIERLIEDGDRLSPVLDVVARANRVTRVQSHPSTGADRGEP